MVAGRKRKVMEKINDIRSWHNFYRTIYNLKINVRDDSQRREVVRNGV